MAGCVEVDVALELSLGVVVGSFVSSASDLANYARNARNFALL